MRDEREKAEAPEIIPSEPLFEGEFPPIEERLVVSPGWGHLHRRQIREGRSLIPGAVIGDIRVGQIRTLVRTPTAGVFISWLVAEGDAVDKGRPLARLQP
jgi:biotin carboxyl carrier protein